MFKLDTYRLRMIIAPHTVTRHERAQRAIREAKIPPIKWPPSFLMYSQLPRPQATPQASPLPAPTRKIEVKAGNLGTQMGLGYPIIVRIIKTTQIEVHYEN